ncbi:putative peroxisome targeting signal 1 receptor [Trypanosoma conorhini]|uniref:Putative peroxisome targeting signal 1 receptor n=1 Tax=Trypanosoma conorhini TaxID=83891 RepID=A0A422NA36_9TRYP|nr:putative peroxisome targeting signal 1 receptor [Trypanosoma conorhini]RNF02348.1 putative peroxisome targeting signal 1 receptor [Trypanosoma conorhini]
MNCGTGAALGQQLAKDAFHMHGGVGVGPTGNPEQDALMSEMLRDQSPTGHAGDWGHQFAAQQQQHHHHHHHPQQMAVQRQQNENFMLRQQQEMEEAFRAVSATHPQQQPLPHHHLHAPGMFQPALMGPHMMGPMMHGAGMGAFMGAAPPTMAYAPTAFAGNAVATASATNAAKAQEATAESTTTEQQQQQQGDSAWVEKLRGAEWGQDYSEAQVFTLEGQSQQTMEEHARNSEFYKFMDQIRTKELLIDEETGQVVQGPGPDPDVPEDTAYLKEWATAEALGLPPGVFEPMTQRQQGPGQQQEGRPHDGSEEAMMDEFASDPAADLEEWAQEYAEMQERIERAQNNTDYPFEPNNPYMYHDAPMEEGLAMLQLANLAEAALAFEAVCQKEPEHVEAWRLLGKTQAENEKDGLAIIALNHARMLNPNDIAVHAALAVSHTNEHNVQAALQALRAWLLCQPQYESLGSVPLQQEEEPDGEQDTMEEDSYFYAAPSEYRDCRTLLNAAVEMNPNDPQLHASLGVLYNLSHRFEEAAANFRRAVELTPEDPQMWNRLGATLANGNKPQEALEAYDRALDINPGYVRAMYNMAVSYSNLAQYPLAAKEITRAIALQAGGTNPQGEGSRMATRGLWDLLRMTLNLMDRTDLVELSWQQDVKPFLREFGLENMEF